jgi:mannose/cellobiose epimerase-like protein (N-acyl-D-glucosamine 2-epimerase family)
MKTPDFRSPEFLRGHISRTLDFYQPRCVDPSGGFFHHFKDDGRVYDASSRHLVSSTRFIFNHAMGARHAGRKGYVERVRHGLRFLDHAHALPGGGHAWTLKWDGHRAEITDATLHAYGQAFVLLAHAHALMAGVAEAEGGLRATIAFMESRFWLPEHGLYADEISPEGVLQPYRGQNANMHACEAMLAAHEATGDTWCLQRALTLAESVTQRLAAQASGLVWEHHHPDWSPDWGYNRDDKTNIFRPWGHQTGHLTEWTKLLLQLADRLPTAQRPEWLMPTARHFFDTAMARGWDEAHGGLVYGFAPDGSVCDADKYFWVQAESLAAAAGLALRTGLGRYWDWYDRIWAYSWAHMIDHRYGAWFRTLTPDNRAYSDDKSPAGKTDYHTMGACWDVLRFMAGPGT